ncbi:acyl carrier protein [Ramlibacter ginsenosidimutans]|uniref:Acyl carrier protein n=1 Tax=Ramlibacter ginsenosidimutans TaxID=502333 RepID=A0A934TWN4_9BURK|nr:acyl carrier protein [Ramlibacter ginsenosidimutans]MBK6008715.1 acyl carrier protein [Ramlibacter ginsenosidimutans]
MDTIEALKQLIHSQFDIEPAGIDPDAPFAQYNLDSLTVAELMFAVEDQFHVQVPDTAMSTITSLRGLASMLDELRAAKAA